jgi:membrane protease YdiL (CAAX protease family)
MIINKKYISLLEAILCSLALMFFSFIINSVTPLRLFAIAALIVPAWFFSRNLQSLSDLRRIAHYPASTKITVLYCFAGILAGILFSTLYRWHLGMTLFPQSFHLFVLIAALIGATEELVFRGFIQDHVKKINTPFSILFGTLSHTAYKCCLFLSPMASAGTDIRFLAFWTLIAGILAGTIKHFSKSILPPVIAHSLFDILVYAGFVNAPWWVW